MSKWTVIRIWDDVEAATADEAITLTAALPHGTAKAKRVPDDSEERSQRPASAP